MIRAATTIYHGITFLIRCWRRGYPIGLLQVEEYYPNGAETIRLRMHLIIQLVLFEE
jgi:hypothetical protein